jgi:siroheme synthase
MGLARLDHIVSKLLEHGAAVTLPAAIVARGTLPNQRIIAATLGTILDAASRAALESPALLVVGEVVALQSKLAWFSLGTDTDVSQSA